MNDPPAKFTFFYCTPSGKKNQFNSIGEFSLPFRMRFAFKNAHKPYFGSLSDKICKSAKIRRTLFFI